MRPPPLQGPGHSFPAAMTAAASSSSFFTGAPTTKFLCVLYLTCFLTLRRSSSSSSSSGLSASIMLRSLTFPHAGDLIMGGMLIVQQSRQWERLLGSRQLIMLLLWVQLWTVLLGSLIVGWVVSSTGSTRVVAGPYAYLGALMYLFHVYTPRIYPKFMGLLGLDFSEKTFTYLWAGQVVLVAGGNAECVVAALGAVACAAFLSLPVNVTDLPEPLVRVASRYTDRWADSPPRLLVPVPGGGTAAIRTAPTGVAGGATPAPPLVVRRPAHPFFGQAPPDGPSVRQVAAAQRHPPPPDPAAVEQLCGMGFARSQVEAALQYSNNNVEQAADRLLTQMNTT